MIVGIIFILIMITTFIMIGYAQEDKVYVMIGGAMLFLFVAGITLMKFAPQIFTL